MRSIYAGDRRSWQELGGPAAPITVITREDGSGTRAAFEELVMGGRQIAARALVQDSSGSVRQMVAADPAAIGYISLGLVDATVKAVALDGVAASEATIDAGRYPLVRPFLFVVAGTGRADARAFIDWITGPEGRDADAPRGPPSTALGIMIGRGSVTDRIVARTPGRPRAQQHRDPGVDHLLHLPRGRAARSQGRAAQLLRRRLAPDGGRLRRSAS